MDRSLVIQAQTGDRVAFARLADAEWERLRRIAYGILRRPDLADDAAQTALLSVWRDLPRLRDPDRYEAWVHRLLVRRCYAEAKRARLMRERTLPLLTGDSPEEDAIRTVDDRDQLERCFRRLGLDQRIVLVLHYYQGLPLNEIADAMGVPAGTIYSRLHRALREMRGLIEADARTTRPAGAHREAVR